MNIYTNGNKKKKEYESPATQVVEMKSEGILCGSGEPSFSPMYFFGDDFSTPFDGGGEDW